MTRRGDLKLSHGATAKARENTVKAGSCAELERYQITLKGPDFCAGRSL